MGPLRVTVPIVAVTGERERERMKQNSSNGVTKRMDSGMGSSIILAREYVTGEEDPVTRYTRREREERRI